MFRTIPGSKYLWDQGSNQQLEYLQCMFQRYWASWDISIVLTDLPSEVTAWLAYYKMELFITAIAHLPKVHFL